jgi:hypothetical protein
VAEAQLSFGSTGLDQAKVFEVESSVGVRNSGPMAGGFPEESVSDVKAHAGAIFAAQNRIVNREDVIARIMSMPSKFGRPEKVYVKPTDGRINSFSWDVHLLSRDDDGHLIQATPTLVRNVITNLSPYRVLGIGINVLQTLIINLKVEFGVVVSPRFNRTEVLARCLQVVKDHLSTDGMQIGEGIVVSEIMAKIQDVLGVISVYKLQFKNVFCSHSDDAGYSPTRFSVQGNLKNNILYCPTNAIFEIRNPNRDIVGEGR